jgi:CO/xanthine dehydrogenase Mo-binding subunit
MEQTIGKETVRKDAWQKVEGRARFNDDDCSPACLQARLLTSAFAHAEIVSIDASEALAVPGVRAVATGAQLGVLTGSILRDMPILANGVVRYFGEPVAIAVADEEWQAAQATKKIKVEYKPLPAVNSLEEALKPGAVLVHPKLGGYERTVENVYPEAGTNISNRTRIRKGNMAEGWAKCAFVAEAEYALPQANHAFMETRNARAEILPGGHIVVHSATQAPHATRELIAKYFQLTEGTVTVHAPFVGGGFGGKVNPHPELMAYVASRAVGGREVRISLTRGESFFSTACKVGAKMRVRLGADGKGKLQALHADFFIDSGAYSDTAPVMARAAAASCGGAYNIPNIQCDSVCVYTNHVYTTSFRGFGHDVSMFAIERSIEKLAGMMGMDPAEVRRMNALREGDYTPTQVKVTLSNSGNIAACIDRLKQIMEWDRGTREQICQNIVRAKGMACFSKTSSSPTNAPSSAIVTFCADGSVNLNCSVVECGPGMTTALPMLLAERLKVSPDIVNMNMDVDTHTDPQHWKTVASMSTYMAGNAILAAADDAIRQLKTNAALALRCSPEDIGIGGGRAFLMDDPAIYLEFKDIVYGVKDRDGNAVGGPVIGSGRFVMKHLSLMDTETGKGRPGPCWTVGAQAVEVEYDANERTFRLVRAVTVMDAGKVVEPGCAMGQVMGGMSMGLGIATREENHYAADGELKDTSLRTYKVMHFAENPDFIVEFIETPDIGGPYGVRGIAEHGVLGMPPALANALCRAAGVQLDTLPITFESLWRALETT